MKHATKIILGGAIISLAACVQAERTEGVDPITAAVSGKTLTAGDSILNVGADGTLTGVLPDGAELIGEWSVRNGQWCRTINTPSRFAGTACQNAELIDDAKISIDGINRTTIWTIE